MTGLAKGRIELKRMSLNYIDLKTILSKKYEMRLQRSEGQYIENLLSDRRLVKCSPALVDRDYTKNFGV